MGKTGGETAFSEKDIDNGPKTSKHFIQLCMERQLHETSTKPMSLVDVI